MSALAGFVGRGCVAVWLVGSGCSHAVSPVASAPAARPAPASTTPPSSALAAPPMTESPTMKPAPAVTVAPAPLESAEIRAVPEGGSSESGGAKPVAAADAPPLLVEVRGQQVLVAGQTVPNDVLSLRGALARGRRESTLAHVRLRGADSMTLGDVLVAASGTDLSRVVLIDGTERSEIALRSSRPPSHELSMDLDGQAHLRALTGDVAIQELAWKLGEKNLAQARSLFAASCPNGCLIEVAQVPTGGAPMLLLAFRSLYKLSRGRSGVEVTIRPQGAVRPIVKLLAPNVRGRLPPEVVQRVVRQSFTRLRQCYENGLLRNRELAGTVGVRFVIGPDGHVAEAKDTEGDLPDAQARACVVQAFKLLEFPKPEEGNVIVVYSTEFLPPPS